MVRHNGQLRSTSWNEALDRAAAALRDARRDHGPESILHYRSGGSLGILKHASDLMFARFGPVTVKRGDICSGAGEAAQEIDFGVADSNTVEDLDHSPLIIVWGKNPHTSGVHLLPRLKAAKARGAKIVGIDPVRTRMAGLSDIFLQVRPGADYAVAMAMLRHLFERHREDPSASTYCDHVDTVRRMAFEKSLEAWANDADVPAELLAQVADLYGATKPAAILVGWGLGRRKNGGATVRALDALGALSGNVGVSGGGVSYYMARRTAYDVDFGVDVPPPPRTLAEARLGEEIENAEPPVRVVWVTAGNPVAMLPDSERVQRALTKTFTIVVDTHPTDTTDVADIVLPTRTLLEDEDLLGAYGNHYLRASRPALEAPPDVRHELAIWQGLAERLDLGEVMAGSINDWKRRATRRLEAAGVPVERIEKGPVHNPFAPKVLFADRVFRTDSKRAALLNQPAAPPAFEASAPFPMSLLAVSTPEAQSSQWTGRAPSGPPDVHVHPDAAAGIADGAVGRLVSQLASLQVRVRHDATLRPDVALMAKGGQLRDGQCPNILIRAIETDIGGGAAYYDEGVRLERIG